MDFFTGKPIFSEYTFSDTKLLYIQEPYIFIHIYVQTFDIALSTSKGSLVFFSLHSIFPAVSQLFGLAVQFHYQPLSFTHACFSKASKNSAAY